jgi:CBS domain-containing protein
MTTIETTDLRVGDVMSFNPVVIGPEEPATEAERLIKTYRVSGLPVVDDGVAVGVVSQTDLAVARSSELISANWPRMRVRHLMSVPAVSVHLGTSMEHAARLMLTRHIHRPVVVDDEDRAIGVVSSLDLLRALVDDPDIV